MPTTPHHHTRYDKMKRKLDENDEPVASPEAPNTVAAGNVWEKDLMFSDLGLDPRLLQAIVSEGFKEPTLVQRKAIPLALESWLEMKTDNSTANRILILFTITTSDPLPNRSAVKP